MAIRPAHFLPVRLTGDGHRLAEALTQSALPGYRYVGTASMVARGSEGPFAGTRGTYVHHGLVWLQPAQANSLFHAHRLAVGRRKLEEYADHLNQLAATEAQAGYHNWQTPSPATASTRKSLAPARASLSPSSSGPAAPAPRCPSTASS